MLIKGILINPIIQFERLYKHNRQGSIHTKRRYREAFLRPLTFLAEEFRLEQIQNIAPKHIHTYVAYLLERGRTIAYIKTESSPIRFWHDQIPGVKYKLPSNEELQLVRRRYGAVDRIWSGREFNMAITIAMQLGLEMYAVILCLVRYAGLRLHECFRLNTRDAELALKTGQLTIKGKGGLVRQVPTTLSYEELIARDMSKKGVRLAVAWLLGHGRDSVTKVYLPSLDDSNSYRTNTPE